MSISGSEEVKTARLAFNNASNTEAEEQVQAQEDREIVGYTLRVIPGLNASVRVETELRVGIDDDLEGLDSQGTTDNQSWRVGHGFVQNADTTNGVGSAADTQSSEWYGKGSGVEWNEDATLTAFIEERNGENCDLKAEVHYREL